MSDFFKILKYYKAELTFADESKFVFTAKNHKTDFDFWIFKNLDSQIRCYGAAQLKLFSESDLIYFFENKHNKEQFGIALSLIEGIETNYSCDNLLLLDESKIINSVISLEILNSAIHDIGSYSFEVLTQKPFQDRVFIHKDKLAVPILNAEGKPNNVFFIEEDRTLNNNTGSFTSWLTVNTKKCCVFFSAKELLDHGHKFIATEYFYLLLSNNIDVPLVQKLKNFSSDKSLPLEIFVPFNTNLLTGVTALLSRIMNLHEKPFQELIIDTPGSFITFNFFSPNTAEHIFPLIQIIQEIHHSLIIFFNGELVGVEDDLTVKNNLIQISTDKDDLKIRNSISFLYSPEAFVIVANVLIDQSEISNIHFKTI